MDDVLYKIETLYFEHIVSEDGILDDEGESNVPLENNNNVRYTFTDSNDYGKRTDNEIKKIKCINDCMEALSLVHMFIHQNCESFKPMYFMPDSHQRKLIEDDAPPDDAPPDDAPQDDIPDTNSDPLSECLEEMTIVD